MGWEFANNGNIYKILDWIDQLANKNLTIQNHNLFKNNYRKKNISANLYLEPW